MERELGEGRYCQELLAEISTGRVVSRVLFGIQQDKLTCFRFWWLDLNTFIMEPSYSLQSHVFNNLAKNTYRDINEYNPLNITHPFTAPYLDKDSLSPVGDGKASSINLIIPQDCGGFNLGSFFIKRSAWTDRLLDIWWDPVAYEQKHMAWEHKEQDALEFLYTAHPWIRPHTAFIPQRKINSFPLGPVGRRAMIRESIMIRRGEIFW